MPKNFKERTCIICPNKYKPTSTSQKTCSIKCSKKQKYLTNKVLKIQKKQPRIIYTYGCYCCHNVFNTTKKRKNPLRAFCSTHCKDINRGKEETMRRRMGPKLPPQLFQRRCEGCGIIYYKPKRPAATLKHFHTEDCRQKYYNRRRVSPVDPYTGRYDVNITQKKIKSLKLRLKAAQGKCAFDGCIVENIDLYDFAHYDRKNKSITMSQCYNKKKIIEELSKGRFLCVWHHRLETRAELPLNKDLVIRNRLEYVNDRKMKIGSCELCDIKVDINNTICFDFDHINPANKTECVSIMVDQRKYNYQDISNEIRKCRLLCCNCHRLHSIRQAIDRRRIVILMQFLPFHRDY